MSGNRPRILVPLDGSSLAENALPIAAEFARLYRAEILLLHVLEGDRDAAERAAAVANWMSHARDLAESRGLGEHGFEAEVLDGSPAEVILSAAADAAFVVMATHGRGGIKAAFLGSVADQVVRGSPVPVVVVPGLEPPVLHPIRDVIVALDGSTEAELGLARGRELAKLAGATVTLVRAAAVPEGPLDAAYIPSEDLEAEVRKAAEAYLDSVALPGEHRMVMAAQPEVGLAELAASGEDSLLVMTSTGKGLIHRLVFGSFTEKVMRAIDRPLLIIPASSG